MTGCRIGRVKFRDGRSLTIIDRPKPRSEHAASIVSAASVMASDPKLCGYVMIGLCRDGTYNFGSRIPFDGPIPLTLVPSYVAEIVRRECVTSVQVDVQLEKQGLI